MIACVKFFTSIFAFINFALGCATVAAGIYLKYKKPKFWTLIHLEEYDDYYEYGCWGIVGLGGIVIICSIAGIYGGCAKKKCAVTCYSLGIMILFALFTGIGVMMIIFFQPFYNKIKDDTDCTDNDPKLDFINEANKMYLEAHDKYYCRQYTYEDPRFEEPQISDYSCQCYIQNKTIWTDRWGDDFFTAGNYYITENENTPGAATNLNDCQFPDEYKDRFQSFLDLREEWSPLAEWIEDQFDCSGVCQPQPFYFFHGINVGIPEDNEYNSNYPTVFKGKGCIDEMKKFVGWFKNFIIICAFGAAVFMFINILLSCCICCYSSKNNNWDSYIQMGGYRRFSE